MGVIVLDASDRKRSEEALRKTEKLAATGRLAASIAHEINNPLEAITNLLFLLRNFCQLEDPALNYVAMAEHEAQRISEITQQTLRFYRQSTLPDARQPWRTARLRAQPLSRPANTLNIKVERDYDPEMDLFCFAGELRQVFANLVGNAIDASTWRRPSCGFAPGARATGRIPASPVFALRWPIPERAWSRRCASASSKPSSPPRK